MTDGTESTAAETPPAAQLLVVTGIDLALLAQRLSLFSSLAMSVFGLVLLEHLFRNVSPDFRWSIKPLCLGLGGTFLFDLYLFSDAPFQLDEPRNLALNLH